ncbi:MAG: hypothetical protein ABR503_04730, partial [Chitinophagaceae bacterium]
LIKGPSFRLKLYGATPPVTSLAVIVVDEPLQSIVPAVILAEIFTPVHREGGGILIQSKIISALVFVQPKASTTVIV